MRLNALWWWIDRWRKSTAYTDMTLEQQGAYRNLLDEAQLRGGALPNDERILAKACGDALSWPVLRETVMRRFELRPDGWHNVTLDEVIRESARRAEKQHRYRNRRGNGNGNGGGNADGSPDPSPDPSPEQVNERSFVSDGRDDLTDTEKREYADEVWSEFLRRSNARPTRVMSPAEWSTLKGWLDSEIPLRTVIRGFEDTKGKGDTLCYYDGPVREAATMRSRLVGL